MVLNQFIQIIRGNPRHAVEWQPELEIAIAALNHSRKAKWNDRGVEPWPESTQTHCKMAIAPQGRFAIWIPQSNFEF